MTATERLPDRWHSRDFPVLLAAAHDIDSGARHLDNDVLAARLGLSTDEVSRALGGLRRAGYLEEVPVMLVNGMSIGGSVTMLTERGQRAVGLWPNGEDVDALIDALRQAEQSTTDPAEQGRIRQAAGALMSVSREVMVDVVAAVLAKQTGIG